MGQKRKRHSPMIEAKVARTAVRGLKTSSELSSGFGEHSTMIAGWKRRLVEGADQSGEQSQEWPTLQSALSEPDVRFSFIASTKLMPAPTTLHSRN